MKKSNLFKLILLTFLIAFLAGARMDPVYSGMTYLCDDNCQTKEDCQDICPYVICKKAKFCPSEPDTEYNYCYVQCNGIASINVTLSPPPAGTVNVSATGDCSSGCIIHGYTTGLCGSCSASCSVGSSGSCTMTGLDCNVGPFTITAGDYNCPASVSISNGGTTYATCTKGTLPTPTPTPGGPTPTPTSPPPASCPPPNSCCKGGMACEGAPVGNWGELGCASNERCCKCYSPLPTDLEVWMRVWAYEGTSGPVKGDSGWVYTDDACEPQHLYVGPGDTLRVETMTYNRGTKDLNVKVHTYVKFDKDIKSIATHPDPTKKRSEYCAKCRSEEWETWLDECKRIKLESASTTYGDECHSPKPDMREDACYDPNPGCGSWGLRGAVEGIGVCCKKGSVKSCETWKKYNTFDTDDILKTTWGNRLLKIKDSPEPGITEFEIEASANASQDGKSDSPDTQKVVVHLGAPTPSPTPTPACTVSLSPSFPIPVSIILGEVQTFFANITEVLDGIATKVTFVISGPAGFVSVSPAEIAPIPNPTPPFSVSTQVKGDNIGSGSITGNVYVNDLPERACYATVDVEVIPPPPWFQTQEGDVHATTNLNSCIPQACVDDVSVPQCVPYFSLLGSTGYPGVVSAGSASFCKGSVSQKPPFGWLAIGAAAQGQFWDYFYPLLHSPTSDNFNNGDTPSGSGIYYSANDVRTGNWNIGGGSKIVVLVNGDFAVDDKIRVAPGGSLVVIAKGNIYIKGTLESTNDDDPVLEGIFIADDQIMTNCAGFGSGSCTADPAAKKRLIGKGMFIAGDFAMERDLDKDNATIPAEKFIYRVDLLMNSHTDLWRAKHEWQELPP